MIQLSEYEKAVLEKNIGTPGDQMAMELVVDAAQILGAKHLNPIESSRDDQGLDKSDNRHQ